MNKIYAATLLISSAFINCKQDILKPFSSLRDALISLIPNHNKPIYSKTGKIIAFEKIKDSKNHKHCYFYDAQNNLIANATIGQDGSIKLKRSEKLKTVNKRLLLKWQQQLRTKYAK